MKKIRIVGGILLGLVLIAAVTVGLIAQRTLYRPVTLDTPATVDIRAGTTFRYVAGKLEERGLIPSAAAFKVYARLTHRDGKLKVGEYEVTDGQRPVDILDTLVTGRAKAYWVTIPEGKWASEVPAYFADHWPEAANEMPALIADAARWQRKGYFPLTGNTLEGCLFPDTYRLPAGASAEQIIGVMLKRFGETCGKAYAAKPPADGRSLQEVLILASLVEAEAKVSAERPKIAGVYINRLEKEMRLDCDATILYAHGKRLTRVLYRDLEIDSPYNTYRRAGLPPGPINNPGLASFKAALQPEPGPYYYYVAQGDGSHVFSRTLTEHTAAIRRIRGN